jgi:hypothetical protein
MRRGLEDAVLHFIGEMHKLSEGRRLHLRHDLPTVRFDGALGHAEFSCNLLV